jgi:hypothetical protein
MTTHHKLVLVLALQLGLVGTTTLTTAQLTPPPAAAALKSESAVNKVSLHTTGGFAGVEQRQVVDSATPNPGRSQLFALVKRSDFQNLDARYMPDNQCCDRLHYIVDVTGSDGKTKTVETMDGVEAPSVLFQVITLTGKIGS